MFADAYKGKRILLTGHTGFKGSWFALWLKALGAEVTGIALPPETPSNHWDLLALDINEHHQDIRDAAALAAIVKQAKPEIIFHLAAQPLVRRSYADPLETWSTNVMGTVNLLEACRTAQSVKAIVVITTDKCYENKESQKGYKETDRLGGHDPYSASKAGAELVVSSYRDAFFKTVPLLASARAGNVIGGGDWSEDRLVPDIVRAYTSGKSLAIRNPQATRPWQHVLEPLHGYLLLGQKLLQGERQYARAWNFGPNANDNAPVENILKAFQVYWPGFSWEVKPEPHMHETQLLMLNSEQAHSQLGWRPVLKLEQGLSLTAEWYEAYAKTGEVKSKAQLAGFMESIA